MALRARGVRDASGDLEPASRRPAAADLDALGLAAGPHDLRVEIAATPERRRRRVRRPERAPGARTGNRGLVNADVLGTAEAGRARRQHRARRGRGPRRPSSPRCASAGCASRSTCSTTSRRPARASSPIRWLTLPGVYGTHHIGASTEQAQEAIAAETVRIVRTFKETGQRAERREPRARRRRHRTCWSSGIATGRACWRTSSTSCARRPSTCRRPRTSIFAGAEAAVARINLDAARPTPSSRSIASGHPDVLSVQLVPVVGSL